MSGSDEEEYGEESEYESSFIDDDEEEFEERLVQWELRKEKDGAVFKDGDLDINMASDVLVAICSMGGKISYKSSKLEAYNKKVQGGRNIRFFSDDKQIVEDLFKSLSQSDEPSSEAVLMSSAIFI